MRADLSAIAASVAIRVPATIHRGIAAVGAGAIMDVAHLPAYRSANLPVIGIYDIDQSKAHAVADRHGLKTVYQSLEELLSDPRVEVVDIAVPAAQQHTVAAAAIASGRHVLAQKPFAPDVATAAELVDRADARGTVLAVNQQLRFDEGIAAAHRMVELGWIGTVSAISITVDIWTEWSDWPWLLTAPRLEILNHSIHYHDVVRWFLGEPAVVFCVGTRRPGQTAAGETRTVSTYTYPSGACAVVHANHMNDHGDPRAEFRIDGTDGAVRGTLGLLYDYPHGRPDTLEVTSRTLGIDDWQPYPVTTRWIPDAFLGPMASVLDAAAGGLTPSSSGRDNLGTLRLVEALYASMHTGEAIRLAPDVAPSQGESR